MYMLNYVRFHAECVMRRIRMGSPSSAAPFNVLLNMECFSHHMYMVLLYIIKSLSCEDLVLVIGYDAFETYLICHMVHIFLVC
jgi:hypothetical protein